MATPRAKGTGGLFRPKRSSFWWITYWSGGKRRYESSKSPRKGDAQRLLTTRLGDVERGVPVTPKVGRLTFAEAADDLLTDYRVNRKRSLVVVERRVTKHLTPFFAGRRMATITTSDVRAYIAQRQTDLSVLVKKGATRTRPDGTEETIAEQRRSAANASINRELALLKRMFVLAVQAGKLLHRPHIPMLREDNVRVGFFEGEHLAAVLKRLPAEIQPVIQFAAITGWRIASEVLPLQWRQIDFAGEEVRLDPGTTKNGDGRVFPFTAALRTLLTERRTEHLRLAKAGHLIPQVFFREVADGRGGEKTPRPIVTFGKAWKSACRAAGYPGRIPHDLRRTAVRNLVRAGIPERVAMRLTGHKTPSVFARYDIVSDGDLREAASKLDHADPMVKEWLNSGRTGQVTTSRPR